MREDWIEVELGVVCQINMGQSPPSSTYNTDKKGLPFFQGKAEFTELHPTVEKWCTEPNKIAKINDILLSVRAPVGATNVANQKCAIGRGLAAISYKYDYKYILAYLRLIEKKLDSQGTGTTFRAISGSVLKSQIIPLAPLPIQRAIVLKIENLFASLDKGIADLKTAQEQLKVYRQAVLKKAFEGDWIVTTVGDLFDFVGGGTPSKKEKDYWNGEIPWASVKDIKGDYLTFTHDYITNKGLKNSSANLALKDEVIIVTRISPGKAILTKIDTTINQDLKIAKPKTEMFNRYVFFLFKSIERECVKLSNGTTVLGINLQNLKSIQVPKRDGKEQHAIVREIESRLSVCDKVEQEIALAIERSRNLRQSILKKAFEGRLLSEAEVTACKQEADYEPASELLTRIERSRNERIKAEKK